MSGAPGTTRDARALRLLFLAGLLASIAGGAGCAVWAILAEGLDDSDVAGQVVMTVFLVFFASSVGLIGTLATRPRGHRTLMWLMAGAAVGAAASWLVVIWLPDVTLIDPLVRLAGSLSVAAAALVLVVHIQAIDRGGALLIVMQRGTIASLAGLASFAAVVIWLPTAVLDRWSDVVAWTLVAWITPTFIAVLALPGLARARRRASGPRGESMPSAYTVAMTCPSCGSDGRFRPGLSRCRACRKAVRIDIEEPRCPCGYLLFRLTGDSCPECGRVVEISPATDEDGPDPSDTP